VVWGRRWRVPWWPGRVAGMGPPHLWRVWIHQWRGPMVVGLVGDWWVGVPCRWDGRGVLPEVPPSVVHG